MEEIVVPRLRKLLQPRGVDLVEHRLGFSNSGVSVFRIGSPAEDKQMVSITSSGDQQLGDQQRHHLERKISIFQKIPTSRLSMFQPPKSSISFSSLDWGFRFRFFFNTFSTTRSDFKLSLSFLIVSF